VRLHLAQQTYEHPQSPSALAPLASTPISSKLSVTERDSIVYLNNNEYRQTKVIPEA